jgi:hypothetical protein
VKQHEGFSRNTPSSNGVLDKNGKFIESFKLHVLVLRGQISGIQNA